jgi:hypothetical protein
MNTSRNDRERVYHVLPGDRRHIVEETGLPSYSIPAVLRWLKRRGLAHNNKKGYWEPVSIPEGVELCWEHGLIHLGTCPACINGKFTLNC